MITFVTGDIFDSLRQTVVCPVNAVGVMGNGLALAMKVNFEGLEQTYQDGIVTHAFMRGRLILHRAGNGKQVLFFPTKQHWRNPSREDSLEYWLKILARDYKEYGITSLALPKIGCGDRTGGLQWTRVAKLIEDTLKDMPIPIDVYE